MFGAAGTGGGGTTDRPTPTAAAIDAIDDQVAALTGLANVTTARLVAVVGEALAAGTWQQAGIRSPAHWLAWKAGMSPRRARRLVALAERARELPECTAAFAAGALSEDQVTEIARHVPAAHDRELAELARSTTVPQLQKVVRSYRYEPPARPQDEPRPEPTPDEVVQRDDVRLWRTESGRWQLRADLDPALGALVERALEACRTAVFHERPSDQRVTWADALVRLAESSLAGLLGDRRPSDRHQVVIHVRADRPDRQTWLHLGPTLPSAARRHLSCDATVRYLLEDERGVPLKLGRKQHTVPAHVRTVLEDRDRQCRAPGCTQTRWLEAHHIVHWEDGGRTDLENLVMLCPVEHRLHHLGALGITGDASRPDGLVFTDRLGRVLDPSARPKPPTAGTDLGTPSPQWQHPPGERLDTWCISFERPSVAA